MEEVESLIGSYYDAGNVFIKNELLNKIVCCIKDDYTKALFKSAKMPMSDSFTYSGIITYMPGGNKKFHDKERELIENILSRLDLPYDNVYTYKHVSQLWSSISSLIKNSSLAA